MAEVIQFPTERTRGPRSAELASAPGRAFPGGLAVKLAPAQGPEAPRVPVGTAALREAEESLDDPCDRAFRDALGLITVARLTAVGPAFARLELELLRRTFDPRLPLARREAIAEVFGTLLGRPCHNPELLAHLDAADADERRLAAIALGSAGNAEAFGPLTLLLHDSVAAVGVAAVTSLANIEDDRTPKVFAGLLRGFPARAVRLEVLRRLTAFSAPEVEVIALEHLSSADAEVRLFALRALEPSANAEAAGRHCTRDEDPRVRVLAIELLERCLIAARLEPAASGGQPIGSPETLTCLLEAMGDPVARVRRVAAEAARRVRWRRSAR